jgi:hypothetical protein
MIRYYDRLQQIEEMFPLLHAAYKEYISIDDSNHASWFSSIKFISNKIALNFAEKVLNVPQISQP